MTDAEEYLAKSEAFPLNWWSSYRGRYTAPTEKMNTLSTEERCDIIIAHMKLRDEYIAKFGFAIPNDEAIEVIRGYQPILEVGAGSGYWAYELKKEGIDVIATDSSTGRYGFNRSDGEGHHWEHKYTEVEVLTAVDAIRKYPDRNLLTVWPDYDDPWTSGMLEEFKGRYVIYVGEGGGGCTGDDKFHEILEASYEDIADVYIPHFDSVHDYLTVYKRKEVRL